MLASAFEELGDSINKHLELQKEHEFRKKRELDISSRTGKLQT